MDYRNIVGTGWYDVPKPLLFRAVFNCLFVDKFAAYTVGDVVGSGMFDLDVVAGRFSWC